MECRIRLAFRITQKWGYRSRVRLHRNSQIRSKVPLLKVTVTDYGFGWHRRGQ